MKLIALATMLLSFSALADLDKDIARLSTLADVGTNGGEVFVKNYNVATFKYDSIVKSLLSSIKGSECKFTPLIGREALLRDAGSMVIFYQASEAEKILKRLNKQGLIKGAAGFYWTGELGDSEYCSREDLDIYFTNGKVLVITHDSTT